jgi:hypothetical protein
MHHVIRRIRQLLRWRQFDNDLAEVMAFHREMAAGERQARGLDREAAVTAGRRRFGSGALAADQARDVWIPPGVRNFAY